MEENKLDLEPQQPKQEEKKEHNEYEKYLTNLKDILQNKVNYLDRLRQKNFNQEFEIKMMLEFDKNAKYRDLTNHIRKEKRDTGERIKDTERLVIFYKKLGDYVYNTYVKVDKEPKHKTK